MHRDLKPGNLALTDECDLSVLDFGLARSLNADDTVLSAYVITRWYRSPEVMYWKIRSYDTQGKLSPFFQDLQYECSVRFSTL